MSLEQLLRDLALNADAVVDHVADAHGADPIASRLRDLGVVPGEIVRIVARGPIGADPLVVRIGYTRFALRRAEAARVVLRNAVPV